VEVTTRFAHCRIAVDAVVARRAKGAPCLNSQHELAPAPSVVSLSGFFATALTRFGYKLTPGMSEHEGFSQLSIFKVDGMAFGDVFLFWRFSGLGLDYKPPVETLLAAFALAGFAALPGKDSFAGLFTNHGFVDESGGLCASALWLSMRFPRIRPHGLTRLFFKFIRRPLNTPAVVTP
jgi:hypothetical protein